MRVPRGLLLLFTMCAALPAHAATLYMSPTDIALHRGDNALVSVRLDVDDGECVNVVDGVITYDDTIEPVDISRGNSILSVWVENPVINRDNRTITFAGGIPNGYCGRIAGDPRLTNTIIDIVVASPGFVIGRPGETTNATPTAQLGFAAATKAYLNDGTGNVAPLTTYGATISLIPTTGASIQNDWQTIVAADNEPPTPFSIRLERSENAFSGRYFITFNTTDKQTGIDYYEVMEEPLEQLSLFMWGAQDAPWREARSPYLLRDQSLNSTIRVRAIDKAGNEYVATLVPEESQRTLRNETYVLIGLIGLVLFGLLAGFSYTMWRFYSRRRTQDVADTDNDDMQAEKNSNDEIL